MKEYFEDHVHECTDHSTLKSHILKLRAEKIKLSREMRYTHITYPKWLTIQLTFTSSDIERHRFGDVNFDQKHETCGLNIKVSSIIW